MGRDYRVILRACARVCTDLPHRPYGPNLIPANYFRRPSRWFGTGLSIRWLRVRVPSSSLTETLQVSAFAGFFRFWGPSHEFVFATLFATHATFPVSNPVSVYETRTLGEGKLVDDVGKFAFKCEPRAEELPHVAGAHLQPAKHLLVPFDQMEPVVHGDRERPRLKVFR